MAVGRRRTLIGLTLGLAGVLATGCGGGGADKLPAFKDAPSVRKGVRPLKPGGKEPAGKGSLDTRASE